MHQAASWGWIDCVKMLVEAGADLQKRTKYGERARECAARYHQQQCIEILDKSGLYILFSTFQEIFFSFTGLFLDILLREDLLRRRHLVKRKA